MRAWWWILITAHLVCGNPERSKDDYGNTVNVETNQNSPTEDKAYPSFILNPKTIYTSIRRSSEGDEREKKQMRFHSWGGKRQGDEEEEDVGDSGNTEDIVVLHEPGGEDLITEVSSYVPSNESHWDTDTLKEEYTKHLKSFPALSSWEGKGEPEVMNTLRKRSNIYSPMSQENTLDSKLEQSRKRYPSFSSWAGKRAAAFNSWGGKRAAAFNSWGGKRAAAFNSWAGKRAAAFNSWAGKRDYSTENRDYPHTNRDNHKPEVGFHDYTVHEVNSNDDHVHKNLNSNSLDSENFNIEDLDPDLDNDEHPSRREIPEDIEHRLGEERHFLPEYDNSILKRAAAFNSWGGKRMSEENPAIVKKPVSFNSWAGKRAAAFNSWGGKRAAAFTSWGGKRSAAFNSWGGKRAAAFNSWNGKRAAAFNSWGGKRAAAFNSWGGKRAAAFNSWGGKRAAAFNSWGGKRDFDQSNENPEFEYPNWIKERDLYDVHFPIINRYEKNIDSKSDELLDQTNQPNRVQDYILKAANTNHLDKTKEKVLKGNVYILFNDKPFTSVEAEDLNNYEKDNNRKTLKLLGHSDGSEKRARPSFTSWAGKRSPLFSSWYGSKIPAVMLTSGKRRPAFSSWGGKRSEHKADSQLDCSRDGTGDEQKLLQKPEQVHGEELSPPEPGKTYTRKKRETECNGEKSSSVLTIERDKRASGNLVKNRVVTRMMLQGGWPMAFQSVTRGKDFFAWGGKRSLDATTLR